MKMFIYGLFDPRNGELRYVGFTSKIMKTRLSAHISRSKLGRDTNYKKNRWINELLKLGLEPEMDLIQETTEQNWVFDEQWNIEYFRAIGCDLLNYAEGGSAPMMNKRHSPEAIAKMKKSHIGQKQSPETIAKSAATRTGMKMSPEAKKSMSVAWEKRRLVPESAETRLKRSLVKIGVNIGEMSSQSKLTNAQRLEIVAKKSAGVSVGVMAIEYRVDRRTVYNVINSKYKDKWA